MLNPLLRVFSLLSSFFFTIIVAGILFFFLNPAFYQLILGLIFLTVILTISRTNFLKISRLKRSAKRRGLARSHRNALAKAMRNRFFSGHIARAFLMATIIFWHTPISLIILTVYLAFVILAAMKLRLVSLFKAVLSTILGTISGVIGIIFSNFIF